MIQLSACLIVKNEADLLPRCLESIRAFVDEIIVVDTGSTDNTVEMARNYGAQVHFFSWIEDFSAARNKSLSYVRGEWILYIDADEAIDTVNAAKIRQIINRKDITAVTVRQCIPQPVGNIATAFYSEYCRIFRFHPDIRFEGKIHEQILPAIERLGGRVLRTDIVFHHWAYAANGEKKRRRAERNLRYLLAELERVQDDPFLYFNLGLTYRELGQQDAAIRSFHHALDRDDGRIKRELIGLCHLNLAKIYLESGNGTKAAHHSQMYAAFDPTNPLSAYMLATLAVANEQFNKAIFYLETAIRIAKGGAFFHPSVELNLAQIFLELGSCHSAVGDLVRAEQDFARAIEYNSSIALPYLLRGNCRFMLGDKAGAKEMFGRALTIDSSLRDAKDGLALCSSHE
ncbi:MAG: glycosyltransferase [Candidatus Brocadia sp.]|nr:glycosyltransferase [Candidatus Brocadia sp.]